MKVTIDGYVVCSQYPWDDAPKFVFTCYDPTNIGSTTDVVVMPYSFAVEVPDSFDPRPQQVVLLEKKKQELLAKFATSVKEIDDRINSLLAIDNSTKVVNDGTTH